MIAPRLFLCSGVHLTEGGISSNKQQVIELDSLGDKPNVNIKLENVTDFFKKHLPERLIDLLEIAAYVYAADCSTNRGEEWTNDRTTESWGRDLQFIIPVRDLRFWETPEVDKLLKEILKFLSNDDYLFNFCQLTQDRPLQEYLDLSGGENWPFYDLARVYMFSGGLDSLAGAIQALSSGRKVVLVSHRSVAMMDKRQKNLVAALKEKYPGSIQHIPIWINKDAKLSRETTQRTRSFLFSAIGTVIAHSVRAEGISFFENGIVSLNLPVADEVLRARATRTTHPQSLSLFSKFYKLIVGNDMIFDNPYLFKTKADVVSIIAKHNGSGFIPLTCSCAHSWFKSKTQPHCGTCSQCIDRRIAMMATGQLDNDLETDYASDVFIGPRKDGYEKNMAVDYVRHALELNNMSEMEIARKFNLEITRAVRVLPKSSESAQRLVELHKQHGLTVKTVLDEQIKKYSSKFLDGSLDESSMLALIAGMKHTSSSWQRYAERIKNLLERGLPITCKTHKPENELHLQEICDGIIKANDNILIREFPFLRWSSALTKPDGSVEALQLWVEYKYVRERKDIRNITEDIAADITKYGDNNRNVMFLIYDPNHLVTDEKEFSEPIIKRKNMLVHFLR